MRKVMSARRQRRRRQRRRLSAAFLHHTCSECAVWQSNREACVCVIERIGSNIGQHQTALTAADERRARARARRRHDAQRERAIKQQLVIFKLTRAYNANECEAASVSSLSANKRRAESSTKRAQTPKLRVEAAALLSVKRATGVLSVAPVLLIRRPIDVIKVLPERKNELAAHKLASVRRDHSEEENAVALCNNARRPLNSRVHENVRRKLFANLCNVPSSAIGLCGCSLRTRKYFRINVAPCKHVFLPF